MKFRTELDVPFDGLDISHDDKMMFLGSCFAETIGDKMNTFKFNTLLNPSGIVFNPVSVFNVLGDIINEKGYTYDDLEEFKGRYYSFSHHSKFTSNNADETIALMNDGIQAGFEFLKDGDYLFITFGSAYAYKHKKTGKFVANCHKVPSHFFEKELLEPNQLIEAYKELFERIVLLNPSLKVVFTISPVRHLKDGIIENQRSKSILNYVVHSLVDYFSFVYYFPSYELLIDDLRDYRFYADDMTHPSDMAIEYVWDKFSSAYFDQATIGLNKRIEKINKSINHKPFNKNSEEYVGFLKKLYTEISMIQNQLPLDTFNSEVTYINKHIL